MRVFILIAILFAFVPSAQAQEGHYICPMHPHITGEEGDKCPICGMYLTPPAEEEAQQTDNPEQTDEKSHQEHGDMPATPMMTDDMAEEEEAEKDSGAATVHICPMHPHITGEEGDSCPICGMFLTPKETGKTPAEDKHNHGDNVEGSIHIDPSYTQTLGVKTAAVQQRDFGESVRAFGQVAGNMRNEHEIALQAEGWVKKLEASAVGDSVKKGEFLFSIYSPDLMAAQSDYMIGRRTGYRIGNPEQRLRLKGMDDQAIALLKKKGEMMERTPFHAPVDGTITALNIREGSHVSEGEVMMTIQDFSEVWVNADVPLRDLQFIEEGMPATIKIPETGDEFETVVDFIHPVSDAGSRTATVRLILDNPEGKLKPDTYVDVAFRADEKMRLAVPSDAVLYGSMGSYVFEDLENGNFRPVMVKTGITSNGYTEIKSGLTGEQKIVASGQFMIDAESNLRGGMAAMDHGAEDQQAHVQ